MSIYDILKTAGVIAVTSLSQMSGILDSTKNGKAAIINVYSEYCGYSHMMANVFVKYVPLNAGKSINFYGADANNIQGLTEDYKVGSVPTFIGMACGREIGRVVGAKEDDLSRLVTEISDTKC